MAKDCYVHIVVDQKSYRIPWTSFTDGLDFLHSFPRDEMLPLKSLDLRNTFIRTISEVYNPQFAQERRFQLLNAHRGFFGEGATNPLDILYAMYGILRRDEAVFTRPLPPISYSRSIADIFEDFTVWHIGETRGLGVFKYMSREKDATLQCTLVPDFSKLAPENRMWYYQESLLRTTNGIDISRVHVGSLMLRGRIVDVIESRADARSADMGDDSEVHCGRKNCPNRSACIRWAQEAAACREWLDFAGRSRGGVSRQTQNDARLSLMPVIEQRVA